MSDIQQLIQDHIQAYGAIGHHAVMEKYTLNEGQEFPDVVMGKRGKPRQCFKNAADLVMRNPDRYDYVEGYMVLNGIPLLIHHAWVWDKEANKAVEVTTDGVRAGYYGVRYDRKELMKWLMKNRYYGIHASDIMINAELMEKYLPEGMMK